MIANCSSGSPILLGTSSVRYLHQLVEPFLAATWMGLLLFIRYTDVM